MSNAGLPSDLRIVPLAEVPEEAVLDLLHTCLGPAAVERDLGFWRWKHRANPFGVSPGLVALASGQPVAVRAFLRWRWRFGERTLDAVRAVDTATHPEWRRRGLFRHLTRELVEQCRREGTGFVFNTPNPTSRAGYLALGWRDVGPVPLLVRPLRPWRLLTGLLRGRAGTNDPAEEGRPPGRPVADLLEAPGLTSFLAAWNRAACRREPRLHTPRTCDYLRWRYGDAPGLRYAALWSLDGGTSSTAPRGAVVVTRLRRRRGLTELSLSELLFSEDDGGRRRARELLGRIRSTPTAAYAAALAARGTAERRLLRSVGFLASPSAPRLTVLPMTDPPPDLDRTESWRPSAGDLELF